MKKGTVGQLVKEHKLSEKDKLLLQTALESVTDAIEDEAEDVALYGFPGLYGMTLKNFREAYSYLLK